MTKTDIIIIGGGIIGVSSAYFLTERGFSVTLIEKNEIGAGASHGNAGLICPCICVPIPAPGVLTQGLKWLLDSTSPFYIKPRLDPDLMRWLWQFRGYCNATARDKAMPLLRDMQRQSLNLYRALIDRHDIDCYLQEMGGLGVYKTAAGVQHAREDAELLARFGLDVEFLDGDAIRELEPIVHPDVIGGIYHKEDAAFNPARFLHELAAVAQQAGVNILTGTEVLGFEQTGGQISAVLTTQDRIECKQVVLSAGIWSTKIAKDLGVHIPLQAAKGYSVTLDNPGSLPSRYLYLGEAKVAITPMGSQLRLAGVLELAGINDEINQRRVDAMMASVDQFMVGVSTDHVAEVWSGMRPTAPDGLPFIGRTNTIPNLIIATGHAMLGVSMGPITGRLVAQIASEEQPEIDLSLLSADRFAKP